MPSINSRSGPRQIASYAAASGNRLSVWLWSVLLALLLGALAGGSAFSQTGPATTPDDPLPARIDTAPVYGNGARSAQFSLSDQTRTLLDQLAATIASSESTVQAQYVSDSALVEMRAALERAVSDANRAAQQMAPALAEVRSQIDKLGPAPPADQPPESEAIAAERTRLTQQASVIDGAIRTLQLNEVRSRQLLERVVALRHQRFTQNLLGKQTSPLRPSVWSEIADRMPLLSTRASYFFGEWMSIARQHGSAFPIAFVAAFAGALLLYVWARLYVGRKFARSDRNPNVFERTARASWCMPFLALPAILAAIVLYVVLDVWGLVAPPYDRVAQAALIGIAAYATAAALLTVTFNPARPYWRIVPVSDTTARRLSFILRGFIAVFFADTLLTEIARLVYAPLSLTVVLSFITSVLYCLLLVWLLLTPFEPQRGPDRPFHVAPRHAPGRVSLLAPAWIKFPLLLLAIAIGLSSSLGYVALGRFISHQLVLSGMILTAVGLARLLLRAATRDRPARPSPLSGLLERTTKLEPQYRRLLNQAAEGFGMLALMFLAVPFLLLQWGFSGADIRGWLSALLFGFEVGQLRISLLRILIGVMLFLAFLLATRMLQRWLRDTVFAGARVDSGIANSIHTAVGYIGIGLAALIAVAYAGFDITNLAIVAGALSIGIGFGLQSIVNNFVSGLILLVERPIKVGDWIVVGNEQGNVRKISVRSTEIETFDRASLIVPNSELITGRVLNWTHRNKLGRIILRFPTAQVSDPRAIQRILVEAAESHPMVMRMPQPVATLEAITPLTYEFALRATLTDVTSGVVTQSELRIEIQQRLREANALLELSDQQRDAMVARSQANSTLGT